MSGWHQTTLDEVCIKITDGAHNSPKSVEVGMPMASVKDLNFFGLDIKGARRISKEDYDFLVKQGCKPEVGDVLIAKDGNSALDTVCIVREPIDAVLLSSVAILRPDQTKIDPRFLKFYFLSPDTIQYLKSTFISGAAIPRVVLKDFKRAEINLPSLRYQKDIAGILSALDDKIELNQRMNETLEAMAQAIFKSWFVDFDPVKAKAEGRTPEGMDTATAALFPSRLTDDGIPEGWEEKPFSEFIELVGGGTPKTSVPEYWDGDIPWFSVVDSPSETNVFVVDTEKKITQAGLENSSTKILPIGTTIISARGTVGRIAIVGVPMAMNQSCYGIREKNGLGDYTTYFFVKMLVEELKARAHGSVFDTITRDTFKAVRAVLPSQKVSQNFDFLVTPIMIRILKNCERNIVLSKTRDSLLPRLISGKLRVSEETA
jgi:type I restriction enzyme S subunit